MNKTNKSETLSLVQKLTMENGEECEMALHGLLRYILHESP